MLDTPLDGRGARPAEPVRAPRNLYATDGRCHNAQHGSFGHECGKPATWIGTKANGFSSGFCDACKASGDEAGAYSSWRRRPIAAPAPMVSWHRDAAGVLTSVTFTLGTACVEIADEDLDRLLRDARERADSDPHDDALPPDWAVIEAAMEGR